MSSIASSKDDHKTPLHLRVFTGAEFSGRGDSTTCVTWAKPGGAPVLYDTVDRANRMPV